MSKQIIRTDQAPRAIGTYSQAVRVGQTVYLSGQIPLVPETMELIKGDFAQVNQIMAEYFQEPYPARAAIGVAALPKGAAVEMDAILVLE